MTHTDLWCCSINRGISRHKIDIRPTEFLFDLYQQKTSQTNERKAVLDSGKGESQPMSHHESISRLGQSANPESLEWTARAP